MWEMSGCGLLVCRWIWLLRFDTICCNMYRHLKTHPISVSSYGNPTSKKWRMLEKKFPKLAYYVYIGIIKVFYYICCRLARHARFIWMRRMKWYLHLELGGRHYIMFLLLWFKLFFFFVKIEIEEERWK